MANIVDEYHSECNQCDVIKENFLFTPGQLKLKRKICRKCAAANNKDQQSRKPKGPPQLAPFGSLGLISHKG